MMVITIYLKIKYIMEEDKHMFFMVRNAVEK